MSQIGIGFDASRYCTHPVSVAAVKYIELLVLVLLSLHFRQLYISRMFIIGSFDAAKAILVFQFRVFIADGYRVELCYMVGRFLFILKSTAVAILGAFYFRVLDDVLVEPLLELCRAITHIQFYFS